MTFWLRCPEPTIVRPDPTMSVEPRMSESKQPLPQPISAPMTLVTTGTLDKREGQCAAARARSRSTPSAHPKREIA